MVYYSLTSDHLQHYPDLPDPWFQPGDLVRTVVGEVDGCVVKTELVAPVEWYGWHWKRSTWTYRLRQGRGRRGRWYLECQLVMVKRSGTRG